jgi:hypothetical protein
MTVLLMSITVSTGWAVVWPVGSRIRCVFSLQACSDPYLEHGPDAPGALV